jgi:hypothetical protein
MASMSARTCIDLSSDIRIALENYDKCLTILKKKKQKMEAHQREPDMEHYSTADRSSSTTYLMTLCDMLRSYAWTGNIWKCDHI